LPAEGILTPDLSKLKEALPFRPKPRSAGLVLDVRVAVQRKRTASCCGTSDTLIGRCGGASSDIVKVPAFELESVGNSHAPTSCLCKARTPSMHVALLPLVLSGHEQPH
jgi:hypothetical protein